MNTHPEIIAAFQASNRPLIVTHENADGDAVGAALATFLFLTKIGKNPTLLIDKAVPEALSFLPGADQATFDAFFPRELTIRLDASTATPDSLKWAHDQDQKQINIVVTPKTGRFDPDKITFAEKGVDFDSIFILDVGATSRLGKVFEKNRDLFENLPTINIDHHPDNPSFGKLNLVESDKSSTTEILFHLFTEFADQTGEKIIDPDIATCLLAGIISDTGSFQFQNTKAATLEAAAELVQLGARRNEIIHHIYQSRHLSTLRLWGRILAKMQIDPQNKIAWSSVSQADLDWAGATMEDRKGLVSELMTHVAEADMILLLTESENGTRTSVRTKGQNTTAADLASQFGGGGHERAAGFLLKDKNLEAAEPEILAAARSLQQKTQDAKLQPVSKIPSETPVQNEKPAPVQKPKPTPDPAPFPNDNGEVLDDVVAARLKELQANQ